MYQCIVLRHRKFCENFGAAYSICHFSTNIFGGREIAQGRGEILPNVLLNVSAKLQEYKISPILQHYQCFKFGNTTHEYSNEKFHDNTDRYSSVDLKKCCVAYIFMELNLLWS